MRAEGLQRASAKLKGREGPRLAVRHLLRHVEDELPIPFIHFAQQAAKLVEKAGIFPHAAPGDVVGRLSLGEVGELRRLFAIVKELIERHLESASQLFQRLDGGDSVAILDTGDVAAEQARSLLGGALVNLILLAHSAKAVTNNHGGIIHAVKMKGKRKLE